MSESPLIARAALIRPQRNIEHATVPTRRKKVGPWIWPPVVFVSAAGLTFLTVYIHAFLFGNSLAAARFVEAILPHDSLGLRIEYQGQQLLLTWNKRSRAARAAVAGNLRIEDSGQYREVHLSAEQAAEASILYRPASDDVTFRLELRDAQGNASVESMRVLGPSNTPSVNGLSPTQPRITPNSQPPPTAF